MPCVGFECLRIDLARYFSGGNVNPFFQNDARNGGGKGYDAGRGQRLSVAEVYNLQTSVAAEFHTHDKKRYADD
jgi:hypothetical protein